MSNSQVGEKRYLLVVFRSRQHTLKYESVLKKSGIGVEVVSTPREAAIGCGLSLRVPIRHKDRVLELWKYNRPEALAGIYIVDQSQGAKLLKSVRVFPTVY